VTIAYNDFHNSAGNFYGSGIPPGVGTLVMFNNNGDLCDEYYNIQQEPYFVNPFYPDFDFSLQAISPCIDAGDPGLPFDPDSTICDMGAIFYPQVAAPQIEPEPDSLFFSQVTIGESEDLNLTISNAGSADLIISNIVSISYLDIFTTNWNPNDSLIAPGENLELTVSFTPSEAIQYFDYLEIENNCEDCFIFLFGSGAPASSVVNRSGFDPDQFALLPAYPNPFNSATELQYNMAKPGLVSLEIYDINGKSIETLFQGRQENGLYSVTFDASGLPTGIYFARMTTTEFSQTQKLILMK